MTGPYFVDTNVFVYDQDLTDKSKNERAGAWLEALWRLRAGRVSAQVLSELYAVLTRKFSTQVAVEEARSLVETLVAWQPIATNADVLRSAWGIESRFGVGWWDALILAAAQMSGCRYLLSEDFQDGRDYDGVTVIDPFRTDPSVWFQPSRAHDR
jgi:predicted nucleic acid-binding protein